MRGPASLLPGCQADLRPNRPVEQGDEGDSGQQGKAATTERLSAASSHES